jgi:uncharacterized protein YjbJ (UPF0337 family)
MMEKLIIDGNWKIIKGKLKQTYSKLTDSDLEYVRGKEEELLGRLERKLGKSKAEIIGIIKKYTNLI